MSEVNRNNWLVFVFIIIVSIFYWVSIPSVPFHPDESTQIYTSADVDDFINNPQSIIWQAANPENLRQRYRELDAPLTRYAIGTARLLFDQATLPTDWDWTKSWDENVAEGALPSASLIILARFSVAAWFPFSLWFIYAAAKTIRNKTAGWIALVALATNSLVLLHTRRAMAESFLLLTITFFLWMLVRKPVPVWTLAIPASLAFNSKQSTAVLILVSFLVAIKPFLKPIIPKVLLRSALTYLSVVVAIIFLLNPFLWQKPYPALNDAILLRQQLLQAQTEMVKEVSPDHALESLPQRSAVMVYQLFYAQPAVADVANYLQETQFAAQEYLKSPLNLLFRSLFAGSLILILTLFGFLLMLKDAFQKKNELRLQLGWVVITGLLLTMSLVWAVSLPFQRYVLPLIPFCCLFLAYGVSAMLEKLPAFKVQNPFR